MNFIYVVKGCTGKRRVPENIDCSITYIKRKARNGEMQFRVSFSPSIVAKAFRNIGYLICAYDTDRTERIWFKDGDKDTGYKLQNSDSTRYVLAPNGLSDIVDEPKSFVGDYELMFDPIVKMWYIDRDQKIN